MSGSLIIYGIFIVIVVVGSRIGAKVQASRNPDNWWFAWKSGLPQDDHDATEIVGNVVEALKRINDRHKMD